MPLSERVKHYCDDKFIGPTKEGTGELINYCIKEKAEEILRTEKYEKWLVFGCKSSRYA